MSEKEAFVVEVLAEKKFIVVEAAGREEAREQAECESDGDRVGMVGRPEELPVGESVFRQEMDEEDQEKIGV